MKAFPDRYYTRYGDHVIHEGMDLRDYFAAQAMQLTYQFWMKDYYELGLDDGETARGFTKNQKIIAETAYELADAMMEARK